VDALLWNALPGGQTQCFACMHACLLPDGACGRCGVRQNNAGAMRTMVSEGIAAAHVDPIEKKPLYHYLPGSGTFSFGTEGCNFTCSFCQNADISQHPSQGSIRQRRITPENLVRTAQDERCASVAFTYNEPTVFVELMIRTADMALDAGLGTVMVSNGFQSPQALRLLRPRIQAANIDLKSMRREFYRDICGGALTPVLDNLRLMRECGWWLEVSSLLIPGLNDSPEELRDMADFIAKDLGPETPWHVAAFHPAFRMPGRAPTPPGTLDLACRIGHEAGLFFVYPGNAPPQLLAASRDTRCPGCNGVCVTRDPRPLPGFNGRCPFCGHPLPGVWTAPEPIRREQS
jgi:pyruvate formate lyase activating enzyme